MSETNRAPRVRTMLGAQLVFANGRMTAAATIRNLSDTGAKIALDAAVPLPQEFELVIPQRNQRIHAKLVWRNGVEIGVAFVSAPDEAPPPPATGSEIDALRSENAQLRREIAILKTKLETYTRFGA